MGENLSTVEDRGEFVKTLVVAMLSARGRAGGEKARALLKRSAEMLTRAERAACEELIRNFAIGTGVQLPPRQGVEYTVYDICGGDAEWWDEEEEELDDLEELEDDDDDEWLPPEPVIRPVRPGRNDPCWCGSGKKYKKCHLETDEQQDRGEAKPVEKGYDGLRRSLGEFMWEVISQREARRAAGEFLVTPEAGQADEITLVDWMIHDWIPAGLGRRVMDEYLRRYGARLSERERKLVEDWSRSAVRLYEVEEVQPGTGMRMKDMITNEVRFVHETSASKAVVKWDGLLARIVAGERGWEMTGTGMSIPRQHLGAMMQWLEEDRREAGLEWNEYLKRNHPEIRRQPERLNSEWINSLQIRNNDGEKLMLSKSTYRVEQFLAVETALRGCEEFVDEGDGRYVWLRDGKEGSTALGSILLKEGLLTFECNSMERLERGERLLNELAGGAMQHLGHEFTTQEEIRRNVRTQPAEKEHRADVPGGEQIVAEYMERHYREWPDISLPALNGQTPREAAMTVEGRLLLAELLRNFENLEERKKKRGEAYYDVGRLRAELGLE